MRNIFSCIHYNFLFSFCSFRKKLISPSYGVYLVFIIRDRSCCNSLLLNYIRIRKRIKLTMNYICTGGTLFNENDLAKKGNNCSVSFNYWLERYYSKKSQLSGTCNMQTSTVTAKYRGSVLYRVLPDLLNIFVSLF